MTESNFCPPCMFVLSINITIEKKEKNQALVICNCFKSKNHLI